MGIISIQWKPVYKVYSTHSLKISQTMDFAILRLKKLPYVFLTGNGNIHGVCSKYQKLF